MKMSLNIESSDPRVSLLILKFSLTWEKLILFINDCELAWHIASPFSVTVTAYLRLGSLSRIKNYLAHCLGRPTACTVLALAQLW